MSRIAVFLRMCLSVLCLVLLAGCNSGGTQSSSGGIGGNTAATTTPTPPPLTSIAVTPSSFSLPVGNTKQLLATGTFSNNTAQDLTSSVTWHSSQPTIATVSSTGIVTTVAIGNATITATQAGITGTCVVQAVGPISSIEVSPAAQTIHDVTDTLQLTATANLLGGGTANVTNSVTWTVSANGVPANVSPTGLVSGQGTPGVANVVATLDSVDGQVAITLTQGVYVLDQTKGDIFRVDGNLTLDGSGFVAATPPNAFNMPQALTVDTTGRVLVSDTSNFQIVGFPSILSNQVTDFMGVGGNPVQPFGIGTDSQNRIYWIDSTPRSVKRIDNLTGTNLVMFTGPGSFVVPIGLFVAPSGRIFITDEGSNQVFQMDDMNGTNLKAFGSLGSGVGQFNQPNEVWVDGTGHIYVADVNNQRVTRMDDITGANFTSFSTGATGPISVSVDAQGRIYYTTATLGGGSLIRVDDMTGANPVTLTGTNAIFPYSVFVR